MAHPERAGASPQRPPDGERRRLEGLRAHWRAAWLRLADLGASDPQAEDGSHGRPRASLHLLWRALSLRLAGLAAPHPQADASPEEPADLHRPRLAAVRRGLRTRWRALGLRLADLGAPDPQAEDGFRGWLPAGVHLAWRALCRRLAGLGASHPQAEGSREQPAEAGRQALAAFVEGLRLRWRLLRGRLGGLSPAGSPLHYLGSGEALPPPLTSAEEEQLLVRLEAGADTDDVRRQLIERNLRLVVYIARKFDNTRIPVEDLISIGAIGLIKAVNNFDPGKRIKLATFASKCIENEILMYLRRSQRTRAEVSFDQPLKVDWDGNELLLADVHGTEPDIIFRGIEEEVDRTLLRKALTKLSRRERRIVELRFGLRDGLERTQKQVADHLGISQSYISRLEKRIIRQLRREMKRME